MEAQKRENTTITPDELFMVVVDAIDGKAAVKAAGLSRAPGGRAGLPGRPGRMSRDALQAGCKDFEVACRRIGEAYSRLIRRP